MTCPPEALRIGGEFEFSPEAFAARKAGPKARFGGRPHFWTDTGRAALLLAARAIRDRGGKSRVWLPAYACASVTQPFLQAGFEITYYAAENRFGTGGRVLPQPQPGETLLFIHYFGHRNHAMSEAARGFRAAGVWVIEDSVQASLAAEPMPAGDFTVTSLRKVLPVTDGAALVADTDVDLRTLEAGLAPADETFVSARMLAKIQRAAGAAAEAFLPLLQFSESRLDGPIEPRRMSWLSAWMMERIDWESAAAKRRENWRLLSAGLAETRLAGLLQPAFESLDEGDAPLGFPVSVADGYRERLRGFLADRSIYCPVHWPLDHLPAGGAFAGERKFSASMLTLPIDQRMSAAHVDRLVGVLAAYFGENPAKR